MQNLLKARVHIKPEKLTYIVLTLVALLIGILAPFILQEKYFNDAWRIVLDTYNEKGLIGSYAFCMWFYDITSLNKLHFSIIACIQLPIMLYLMSKLGVPRIFKKLYLRNALVYLAIILIGVYICIPSKEFINFIYVCLLSFYLAGKNSINKKIVVTFITLLFFAFFFRPYYALVPIIALSMYLLAYIKLKNRVLSLVFSGLLVACFLSLSYGVIKGQNMSESSREALNSIRKGRADSQTAIFSPVKTDNPIGESIAIFYGFFTVNLPLNGLKFFYKPQVVAFIIWQLLMMIYLLLFYHRCLKNRRAYNHELWIFHLVFAYFIVQGIFEPDLGSAIRHKLGIFPLIWLAMYYDKDLIKRPDVTNKYIFNVDSRLVKS